MQKARTRKLELAETAPAGLGQVGKVQSSNDSNTSPALKAGVWRGFQEHQLPRTEEYCDRFVGVQLPQSIR